MKTKLVPEKIKNRVTYNPITGILLKDNKEVKHVSSNGYLELRFEVTKYYAHRVAWFIMTGEQPNIIDHINGNRSDNSWQNLRNISKKENSLNLKCHRQGQKLGVYFNKEHNKWKVVMPKGVFLGYYESLKEANEVFDSYIKRSKVKK